MAQRPLRAVEDDEQPAARMTIDELAQAAGMTVRNIRNHQTRGLLPPPDVVARTGYYGRDHLERLNLVRDMQADGFNLEAIKRLLATGDDRLVRIRQAVTAPAETETPEIVTAEELAERFDPSDPRVLEKAEKLELLVPLGDGRWEVPSPSLLTAAAEAAERGIDMGTALEAVERVKRSCESIARTFVKLFLEELWKPIRAAEDDEGRGPEPAEAIEALRPVAADTVAALFNQAMNAEVEKAFAREVERLAKSRSRRR